MRDKIENMIKREGSVSDRKESNNKLDFVVSNGDSLDKSVLGRYYPKEDKIEIFLDRIGELGYKRIKKENKDLFDFLESDSNKKSKALDRLDFENVIDDQFFDYTNDKITEVLLHELTHRFGNAHHPEDYKAGNLYFINFYIDRLYKEASFSKMETEAKELLKKCYNIQSYTTNDFNSKIRKVIDYCNAR